MSTINLPLGWPSILHGIVAGPGLWATPIELEERIGLVRHGVYKKRWTAIKTVLGRCREMIAHGWLEGCVDGPEAAVTLSPHAAHRLGVSMGGDAWQGFDLRRVPKARFYSFTPEQLSVFFEVPDTEPGPLEALVAQEEHELAQGTAPPHPARTPGTGLHWIWLWRRPSCSHCRGVRLPERHYCLGCGRPWWEAPA